MNTKSLTALALVAVIFLTGALIMAVSSKGSKVVRQSEPQQQIVRTQQPGGGTTGTEAVKSTVQVVSDNVKTQVQVK